MFNFLIITGLNKSGITLAMKMLCETSYIYNPFNGEGNSFWGNIPTHNPNQFPCGHIYTKYNGNNGHNCISCDITDDIDYIMQKRVNYITNHVSMKIPLNKNPYNVVRIDFIKKLAHTNFILIVYRNPIDNAALLKHQYEINNSDWYGVKPKNWKKYINKPIIYKIAFQINSIYENILDNINYIDLIINYENLCNHPNQTISMILTNLLNKTVRIEDVFERQFLLYEHYSLTPNEIQIINDICSSNANAIETIINKTFQQFLL